MKAKGFRVPIAKEMLKDGFRPLYIPVAYDRCSKGHIINPPIREGDKLLPCGCPASSTEGRKEEGLPFTIEASDTVKPDEILIISAEPQWDGPPKLSAVKIINVAESPKEG
jgi:hypothetical protein